MVRKLVVGFRPKDHVELACALAGVLEDKPGGAGEWQEMRAGALRMVGRARRRTRGVTTLLGSLGGKKGVVTRCMGCLLQPCSAGLPYGEVHLDLAALSREHEESVAWVADAFQRLVADLEHVASVDLDVDARAGGRRVGIGELGSLFGQWASSSKVESARIRPRHERCGPALSNRAASFVMDAGISWPASGPELDAAFRRCAFEHHPDRNRGDETATSRFATLKDGYDELKRLAELEP